MSGGRAPGDEPHDALEPLESGPVGWLGSGPANDVVLSSRVRLARNLAGFGFVNGCDLSERERLLEMLRPCLTEPSVFAGASGSPRRALWLDVHRLSRAQRELLQERHIISAHLARGSKGALRGVGDPRAVVVAVPDQRLSVMINEEDHLRLQCIQPGLSLHSAYEEISAADDAIERSVDYAFSARFGYLTACPTNVGTGARLSVMLHLPGLHLLGEIEKVKRAASDMSLAVRGFWGEGSDHPGEFYQISNQTTLGRTEGIMLDELERKIVPKILDYERRARERLLSKRRTILEDTVFRSLGTLQHARRITAAEAMQRLSDVRLGVAVGVLREPTLTEVSTTLLLVQSAHLRRRVGDVPPDELREARARILREAFRGVGS
ncbi:MAG: ATP--guanido phosphotransferase [Phycisphaerales bacterium]